MSSQQKKNNEAGFLKIIYKAKKAQLEIYKYMKAQCAMYSYSHNVIKLLLRNNVDKPEEEQQKLYQDTYQNYINQAYAQLEQKNIFKPKLDINKQTIVYVKGLPVLDMTKAPEKIKDQQKKLVKRIFNQAIKAEENLKLSQFVMQEHGETCAFRFSSAYNAQKFINEIALAPHQFGKQFMMETITLERLDQLQAVPKPELQIQQKEIINTCQLYLNENFSIENNMLNADDVYSQLAILDNNNQLTTYQFNVNSSLKKLSDIKLTGDKFSYTQNGTYIYQQINNKLVFYLPSQKELVLEILLPDTPNYKYTISPCEKFLILYQFNKENNVMTYTTSVRYLFDEQPIFANHTELVGTSNIPLEQHLQISPDSRFMYQLYVKQQDERIYMNIYEISFENFFKVVLKHENMQFNSIVRIQFAPVDSLLALVDYISSNNSHDFVVIQPSASGNELTPINGSQQLTDARITWSTDGKQVSILTHHKKKTKVLTYQISDNYTSIGFSLPAGAQLIDFKYSPDNKYCLFLIKEKLQNKEKVQQSFLGGPSDEYDKPSVYIQQIGSDQRPTKVLSVEAKKLHLCSQTGVFVIFGKSGDSFTVSYVTKEGTYLATYNFQLPDLDEDDCVGFDPHGRYLAVLDGAEKVIHLNIIDSAGQCQLVKRIPTSVLGLKWRPDMLALACLSGESEVHMKNQKEKEISLRTEYNKHVESMRDSLRQKQLKEYEKQIEAFRKSFESKSDVEFGRKQAEERRRLIREVLPTYEEESACTDIPIRGIMLQQSIMDQKMSRADYEDMFTNLKLENCEIINDKDHL